MVKIKTSGKIFSSKKSMKSDKNRTAKIVLKDTPENRKLWEKKHDRIDLQGLDAPKNAKLTKPKDLKSVKTKSGISITPGSLTLHGYYVKLDTESRRKSLDSAISEYGKEAVLKKLNLLRVFNKNKKTVVKRNLDSDYAYVRRLNPKKVAKTYKKMVYVKNKQIGESNKKRDASRRALPPGKRRVRGGFIYEYRKNRTDREGSSI